MTRILDDGGWKAGLGFAVVAGSFCLLRPTLNVRGRWFFDTRPFAGSTHEIPPMPLPRFLKKCKDIAEHAKGRKVRVLVLGNGCAGAENQCMGLLRQLQLKAVGQYCVVPSFTRVIPSPLWRAVPASVHIALAGIKRSWTGIGLPNNAKNVEGLHLLSPPFPDIVIASGRTTAPACVAFKRASQGRTFTVQIQDPRCWGKDLFSAVVTPAHDFPRLLKDLKDTGLQDSVDKEQGGNGRLEFPIVDSLGDHLTIHTVGSLHDVAEEELVAAWSQHGARLKSSVQGQLVAVLVGAPTKGCPWKTSDLIRALDQIVKALQGPNTGIGLAITLSRRSGQEVALAVRQWAGKRGNRAYVFDPNSSTTNEDNPYMALLAGAEVIAVTADSVAMASEAASTSKPILTIGEHCCHGKIQRFHQLLRQVCGTKRAEELQTHCGGGPTAGVGDVLSHSRTGNLDDSAAVARTIFPFMIAHLKSSQSDPKQ